MEAEEIYTIPISPLVTAPFSIKCIADNQISLITERGVHVLELIPSPMSPQPTIKLSRSFIYPSTVLPMSAFESLIDSVIWDLGREETYSLLTEEALVPKIGDLSDISTRIIDVSWSPQDLIHPSKPMLAILTSAGAVELLHKFSGDWYSACDLSSLWIQRIETKITSSLESCKTKSIEFETLVKDLRQAQACAISWSEIFKSKTDSFAYLVTAYRSSHVAVWKVPKISNYDQVFTPNVACVIDLGVNVKINVLHWITLSANEYLIIIGYFNGKVQGVRLENLDGSLKQKTVEKYYDYADRVPINELQLVCQDKDNIKILAVKGSFLLLLHVKTTDNASSTHHLQVNGFTITGIIPIDINQFLITTQNSILYVIKIEENRLSSVELKHNLPCARVQHLGLAQFPTSTMFMTVTSPNSTYDHLVLREPSTIHFFILKGETWDPLYVLKNRKDRSLKNLWDCLELIRIKAIKATDPTSILPTTPSNLEMLTLHDLQISMWMSVITEVSKKKKVIQGNENIVGEISEAQPLIFVHSASSHLQRLAKKSELSEEERLCVNFLRMYLEVYLAGEDNEEETLVSRVAREALKETSHVNPIEVEFCNLCKTVIDDVPWNATKCSSGHKLARCAMTLLQVTTVQYRSCPICGQIFHPCLDKEYEETRCLFCDVPTLYDTRVLDTDSELCKRNLSKQRATEVPKDQDIELLGEERN